MAATVPGRSEGYRPDLPITVSPLLDWPPRPVASLRYLAAPTLWPLGLLWIGVAALLWRFLSPSLETAATFRPGWIVGLYLRNAAVLTAVAGGLHVVLYVRRVQEQRLKYNARWLSEDSRKFSFGNQTRDNMFWCLGSGVVTWTTYEALTLWLYATDRVRVVGFDEAPLYLALLLVMTYVWGTVHFYFVHRALHWPPLYRRAHALHHRNVNTGPWSGISMHPLEHIPFFSVVVPLWLFPNHPVVAVTLLLFFAVSPAVSHSGFDRVGPDGRWSLAAGDYFHHLHHKHFECNYGNRLMPLDKLFGTFHDGTDESMDRIKARRVDARS